MTRNSFWIRGLFYFLKLINEGLMMNVERRNSPRKMARTAVSISNGRWASDLGKNRNSPASFDLRYANELAGDDVAIGR